MRVSTEISQILIVPGLNCVVYLFLFRMEQGKSSVNSSLYLILYGPKKIVTYRTGNL